MNIWKTRIRLKKEGNHFQEVKNGWFNKSLADGLADGSRVKHKRKNSWAVTGQVSGRSAGGLVPFAKQKIKFIFII